MLKMEFIKIKGREVFDEGSWVVEVESSLESEMTPAKLRDGLIHTVPRILLKQDNREFYIPQVVSIEIVKDMMENQLPLWILEEVRLDFLGSKADGCFESAVKSNDDHWFEMALKHLSPIKVSEGKTTLPPIPGRRISYLAIGL
ncbi:hypothetical protein SUGI_0771550 [Cryptomeria japonica]|nr:hypothetical protein SUGI_0771550 [Cryptomeria japonica]